MVLQQQKQQLPVYVHIDDTQYMSELLIVMDLVHGVYQFMQQRLKVHRKQHHKMLNVLPYHRRVLKLHGLNHHYNFMAE